MNNLKEELIELKLTLETVEKEVSDNIKSLEDAVLRWNNEDKQVEEYINSDNHIVTFNVSGTNFSTRVSTLANAKESLFYRLILQKDINIKETIILDRDPFIFDLLMNYLRFKRIDFLKLSKERKEALRNEAEFFEIKELLIDLNVKAREVEFISFEYTGPYSTAGTNRVEDLTDRSLTKGICATSPGFITIELNEEWEFDTIEIGGWNGNTSVWGVANGAGATILTSIDKSTWTNVGLVPSDFGARVQEVRLTRSKGKYIKFNHNSYMGLGYLNIKI